MDHFSAGLSLKTVDMSRRIISGYAAAHNNIDRVRDIIDPSASSKAVRRIATPSDVEVFIGHNTSTLPVGVPVKIEATPRGLYTETRIFNGPVGDNLLAVARDLHAMGLPLGMSIGYRTEDSRHERAANKMVRRIMDYSLKEYSFASRHVTANPDATTTDIKARRRKALAEGSDSAGGFLTGPRGKGAKMQYRVAQEGDRWSVFCDADDDADADDNRLVGTYASQEMANAVATALRREARGDEDDGGEDDEDESGKTMPKVMKDRHDSATMGDGEEDKAVWSTAYVNALPNASFLHVEPGEDDEEGKRVPRSKRHFPYKDANGKIDLAHLRNAIARIPQSDAPGLDKAALQARARRMLERTDGGKTYAEPPEWKAGNPIALRSIGYRLVDLSERAATECKARAILGEDTKDNTRMGKALREEGAALLRELKGLLDWADTVERGADEAATAERWRYEMMAALDI